MMGRDGWVEIPCREADEIRSQGVTPGSSLTDLSGERGTAVMYTEWWNEANEPVLRDYLWHPREERAACEHLVPASTAGSEQ